MSLKELYNQYIDKTLDKHDYIDAMHQKHQALFEYYDYIKDTDVQSIVIDNDEIYVVMKESGIKLYLDRFDSRFIPIEILNFHSFDPVERDLIFFLAGQSKVIFDIGANIGWYSLNFGKLENVDKIYSFEPIPRTYEYLVRHIKFNKISKIYPNNFALSDSSGEVEFYWSETETGSSSMKNIQEKKGMNKTVCMTETLDNFARDNGAHIDMIKCDVEGSELFVFKGGIEMLSRDKPFIFTEMLRKWSAKFDYHPNNIIELLSPIGYQCFAFVGTRFKIIEAVTPETIPTNYFFLHTENHKEIIKSLLG
jgi:FkbM family methyltransferase